MELVVISEVEVSSGTDLLPLVGLDPAPDISEALAEQYLNVSLACLRRFIIQILSMIVLTLVHSPDGADSAECGQFNLTSK
jgi:hypothetical protein